MEFLKELNIVEILKIGSIGLGFLLALMSYMLLKKEQEKDKPNKSVLNTTRTFMLFSILIMLLGIISEFFKTKSSLNIRLGNNEISINELSYSSISELDTKEYFINSDYGFAFKKPNKSWTNVRSEKGLDGLLKIMQVKSKLITKKNLELGFSRNPLGSLFKNATLYYFENLESKTNVSVTDSSGNDLINELIKKRSNLLLDTNSFLGYDTTDIEDKEDYLDEILGYRKSILGFDTIVAKEAFLLSIYPKDSLPDYLRKLKLPGFYTSYSIALGLNTDKLVANEKQILAGAEMNLNNVRIKNTISNFQNKKWLMFTENEQYFFVIEISYSPQISSTTDLWDNLQDALNSFTLIVDR
jgi:hypothetical protein